MRLIAIILTFTVLYLAFKPGIDTLFISHDNEISCCSESCDPYSIENEGQSEDDGNCTGNSCNPFQSCGVNSVLSFLVFDDNLQNQELLVERNFTYQFNIHSQFLSDFWQPPQFT